MPDASFSACFACFSWRRAERSDASALSSWCWRSSVDAFARTSPFLTAVPTLALTSVTVHVPDPAAGLESVVRTGAAPKPRSYAVVEAIVPVAATLSVTSPVVARVVRYWVALAEPASWNPPTE